MLQKKVIVTVQDKQPFFDQDEVFMQAALAEARQAGSLREVPIGAVLVKDNEIIARGRNSSIELHDPSAHAEVLALRRAGQALGNYRLTGTTLYVTVEPCVMCMGALLHARVSRLVFGAADPRAGAAGSLLDLSGDSSMNHRIAVRRGVCEAECRSLLQDFFRTKR